MPFSLPEHAGVQGGPPGRASPAPNQQSGYNLGMGLPSTITGMSIPPQGMQMNGPSAAVSPQQQQYPAGAMQGQQGPPISGQPMMQQTVSGGPLMGPTNAQVQNIPPHNPSYPWSTRPLRLYQPPSGNPPMSPFPRYGLSVPPYPSHSGHMLLFGGLVRDRAHNDLWSLDVRDSSLQLVKTRGEAPLPRIGHVSAIADKIMMVFGGDTKINEDDKQDDGLYVLDLRTQEWTALRVSEGPCGRYGHAACMQGGIFYVHGGHVDGRNFDDLWSFDIRQRE